MADANDLRGEIRADVTIDGDLSGQLAIGHHILQLTELAAEPQVPLTGAGSGTDPDAVVVDPAVLVFDGQEVGTTGPSHRIRLTAPATGPAPLGALTVEGTDAADFTATTDGCSKVTLRSGAGCTVRIRFAPSGIGPRTALLRIPVSDGATAVVVPLRGIGIPAPGAGQVLVPPVVGEPLPPRGTCSPGSGCCPVR